MEENVMVTYVTGKVPEGQISVLENVLFDD